MFLLAALAAGRATRAGGDRRAPSMPPLPKYQQECAACHLAFPPALLPADSWRQLMGNLPQHFGTDAPLDATTSGVLTASLAEHAGTRQLARCQLAREAPPEDRISRSAWFLRQHNIFPAQRGPTRPCKVPATAPRAMHWPIRDISMNTTSAFPVDLSAADRPGIAHDNVHDNANDKSREITPGSAQGNTPDLGLSRRLLHVTLG